jgi:hypothetical protein
MLIDDFLCFTKSKEQQSVINNNKFLTIVTMKFTSIIFALFVVVPAAGQLRASVMGKDERELYV